MSNISLILKIIAILETAIVVIDTVEKTARAVVRFITGFADGVNAFVNTVHNIISTLSSGGRTDIRDAFTDLREHVSESVTPSASSS